MIVLMLGFAGVGSSAVVTRALTRSTHSLRCSRRSGSGRAAPALVLALGRVAPRRGIREGPWARTPTRARGRRRAGSQTGRGSGCTSSCSPGSSGRRPPNAGGTGGRPTPLPPPPRPPRVRRPLRLRRRPARPPPQRVAAASHTTRRSPTRRPGRRSRRRARSTSHPRAS